MFFTYFFSVCLFFRGQFVHVWDFGGVFFVCLFLPNCTASWMLFLPPGMEAGPPVVEVRIPNHLIIRELL